MTQTTKAMNPTTGTVHYAKADGAHLVQIHGATAGQRASLEATDADVTCRTCLKLNAADKPAAAKPAPAKRSAGPVMWGVYGEAGNLMTYRDTKREALAAAERVGGTVRKMA